MPPRDALTDLLALTGAVARAPFTRARPDTPPPRTRITRGPLRVDEDRLAAYARVCGLPYRTGGPTPTPRGAALTPIRFRLALVAA